MARHSAALTSLCNCLRGAPPVDVEWTSVIGLANQTLTTPALIDFVEQFASVLPEDVCAYVRQIYRRNVSAQRSVGRVNWKRAVVAMNSAGSYASVAQGAATLATAPERAARSSADVRSGYYDYAGRS